MSAIEIFIWFLLYFLQLWNLSLVVILPGMLYSLLYSKETWKHELAQQLLPALVRFQIILFVLVMAVYFGGNLLPIFGQFRDAYMAIDQLRHGIVFFDILALTIATGGLFAYLRKYRAKPETGAMYLSSMVLFNGLFLVLFVATSSALFTGTPIQISPFDLVARMIHVLFSAVALTGAVICFSAREVAKKNSEHGEKVAKLGLKWMLIGGSVQVFAGFAMLMAIGMKAFPVPIGHILLTFGILCAIGVVVMSGMSFGKSGSVIKIARATAMTVMLTFFLMVGMRIADLTKRYATQNQPVEETTQP